MSEEPSTLEPVAHRLSELLARDVAYSLSSRGTDEVKAAVEALAEGNVLLLENPWLKASKNGQDVVDSMVCPEDLFVNDDFGTAHCPRCSIVHVVKVPRERVCGLLMKRELDFIQRALDIPERKVAAIIGGTRVRDKLSLAERLLDKVDKLIVIGAPAFSFLQGKGLNIGNSLVDPVSSHMAKMLEWKAIAKGVQLILPKDLACGDALPAGSEEVSRMLVPADAIPDGGYGLDIGPAASREIRDALADCRTIIWYGTAGVVENPQFARGTRDLAEHLGDLADRKEALVIVVGGDSVAASSRPPPGAKALHRSDAGRAALEYLAARTPAAVAALDECPPDDLARMRRPGEELPAALFGRAPPERRRHRPWRRFPPKRFIEDLKERDLRGKRVWLRCNLNVPLNGKMEVAEPGRILGLLPTLQYLTRRGARVILCSHRGLPELARGAKFSLRPVAQALGGQLGQDVQFGPDCRATEEVREAVEALADGDCLLLENAWFEPGETLNDPKLAEYMASLADVFVNDDFGTSHVPLASNKGVAGSLHPRVAGYMMDKELNMVQGALDDPSRPIAVVIGGTTAAIKFPVLDMLLDKVDKMVISGSIAFTFLKARGLSVGRSPVDEDWLELAKDLEWRAKEKGVELILNKDVACTDATPSNVQAVPLSFVPFHSIPDAFTGVDVGPNTSEDMKVTLADCRTIIWYGPLGACENPQCARGTDDLANFLADLVDREDATVIALGESTVDAAKRSALEPKRYHDSDGGYAILDCFADKNPAGAVPLEDVSDKDKEQEEESKEAEPEEVVAPDEADEKEAEEEERVAAEIDEQALLASAASTRPPTPPEPEVRIPYHWRPSVMSWSRPLDDVVAQDHFLRVDGSEVPALLCGQHLLDPDYGDGGPRRRLSIKDLKDNQLKGKKVLLRSNLNVPTNRHMEIMDDRRIVAAVPTIDYLSKKGCMVIVCSPMSLQLHAPKERASLKRVAARLGQLLGQPVPCAPDFAGTPEVIALVRAMNESDVILLENVLLQKGELKNDPELAKGVAGLADFYVNDDFSSAHCAHCSTDAVPNLLKPRAVGFLMERELNRLHGALVCGPHHTHQRPAALILGGNCTPKKLPKITPLLGQVDKIILGGAMVAPFLKARELPTGSTPVEDDAVEWAKDIDEKAEAVGVEVLMPRDLVCGSELPADGRIVPAMAVPLEELPDHMRVLDVGPEALKDQEQALEPCRTIVWYGPMGVHESPQSNAGTNGTADCLAKLIDRTAPTVIVVGGDTTEVAKKSPLSDKVLHESDGGDAIIDTLAGKQLPAVDVLDEVKAIPKRKIARPHAEKSVSDLKDRMITGKTVWLRCNLNVPLTADNRVADDHRLEVLIPTIDFLCSRGAKVLCVSHLGNLKDHPRELASLKPVARRLGELMGKEIIFAPNCHATKVVKMAVGRMAEGDVAVLENTLFHLGETKNDKKLAESMASMADLVVNEDFSTSHRSLASNEGINQLLSPCVSGTLFKTELDYLQGAIQDHPDKKLAAVVGGASLNGKVPFLEGMIEKMDKVIIAGGLAFNFLKGRGADIGSSLVQEDLLPMAKKLEAKARKRRVQLVLPKDVVCAPQALADGQEEVETKIVPADEVPAGWAGLDLGPESLKQLEDVLADCRTIVWYGPVGAFERPQFARGTHHAAEHLAQRTEQEGITTILVGTDVPQEVLRMGLNSRITHVSIGDDASIEYLSGKGMPGLDALDQAWACFAPWEPWDKGAATENRATRAWNKADNVMNLVGAFANIKNDKASADEAGDGDNDEAPAATQGAREAAARSIQRQVRERQNRVHQTAQNEVPGDAPTTRDNVHAALDEALKA